MEFNLSRDILAVAEQSLRGHIAAARGDLDGAVAALREAVRHEDALLYGEPPEWSIPARQELGAVLLAAGEPAAAERAYRRDLDRFRENGWSLLGLAQALEAQGRAEDAAEVRSRFRTAWRAADVEIDESAF